MPNISLGQILFLYLLIINLVTFLLYGIDKTRAKKQRWRIPEKTLILFAAIGGSIGALAGMYVLRHKTRHIKFVVGVPLILIIQILIPVLIFWLGHR